MTLLKFADSKKDVDETSGLSISCCVWYNSIVTIILPLVSISSRNGKINGSKSDVLTTCMGAYIGNQLYKNTVLQHNSPSRLNVSTILWFHQSAYNNKSHSFCYCTIVSFILISHQSIELPIVSYIRNTKNRMAEISILVL